VNAATTTVAGETLSPDGDVVARLRELMPERKLSLAEARAIGERQAGLLLDLWNVTEPPVPQFVIAQLPGIHVDWLREWPTSGVAIKRRTHWQIVLNRGDSRQRQRFSLAHGFKHILDDPVIARLHAHLKPHRRESRAEQFCNYFAACLLMPRPWIKHDYYGGIQNVRHLAARYFVSEEAMTTRLSELGLAHTVRRPRRAA
jgi:hypothetical protein